MIPHRTTWLINACDGYAGLDIVVNEALRKGRTFYVLYRPQDREAVLERAGRADPAFLVEVAAEGFQLPHVFDEDAEVFFLPCSGNIDFEALGNPAPLEQPHCLQPLFANPPRVDPSRFAVGPLGWWGWRAPGALARRILREPAVWKENGIELVEAVQSWPDPPQWQSVPLRARGGDEFEATSPPVLTMSSSVLAVISHYECERWLNACLTSMIHQSRPAENIVVVDDCSSIAPVEIVGRFPGVTLLSTRRNIGPERILNNLIKATRYDAYMVQDADDWSCNDRLELSLKYAGKTGAEMVGTHEIRVDHAAEKLRLVTYPPDVNRAMLQGMSHYLLHCTSLISRELALRVGGFDEKLKLTADSDFVMRAWHAGRIINLPAFSLFHRIRPRSLTSGSNTGYESPARLLEDRFMKIRGTRNLDLARRGAKPNILVEQKERVDFVHLLGPRLRLQEGCEIAQVQGAS